MNNKEFHDISIEKNFFLTYQLHYQMDEKSFKSSETGRILIIAKKISRYHFNKILKRCG